MSICIGNDLEDRLEALEIVFTSLKDRSKPLEIENASLKDRSKPLEIENASLRKSDEYHKFVDEIDHMSDLHL